MRKKLKQNYLDLIPERNPEISYECDENGGIVIVIENKGVFNKIAQRVFKKPRMSRVHLDEQGSCIWRLIDGRRDVMEIAELLKERFGEAVEPLYPRIVRYMQIMDGYGFVRVIKRY